MLLLYTNRTLLAIASFFQKGADSWTIWHHQSNVLIFCWTLLHRLWGLSSLGLKMGIVSANPGQYIKTNQNIKIDQDSDPAKHPWGYNMLDPDCNNLGPDLIYLLPISFSILLHLFCHENPPPWLWTLAPLLHHSPSILIPIPLQPTIPKTWCHLLTHIHAHTEKRGVNRQANRGLGR